MKRAFVPLVFFISIATTLPSWAGYKDLLNNWKTYEPTDFYKQYAKPKAVREISPTPPDRDFEAQVTKIKEMKVKWEKVLQIIEKESVFYRPEPGRLNELLPAGTDPSVAERRLAEGFSIQDLEILAILRNPGVKGAEDRFKATLENYSMVWNLDEILRQYTAFTEDLMIGIGPMKGREPVENKFPFPGILALKGEIVTQEVKASKEALEIGRRTAITQIRKSYWNLLFIHKAQDITREMLGLLKHLEAVAKTRYETGKTSFQDLIKINIEREKVEEDLKTLREQQHNLEVEILKILDLKPTTRVVSPSPAETIRKIPDLASLYPIGLDKRQELNQFRAAIGKMERMIEMAETAIYPSFSLNLSLYQDEAISQVGTFRKKDPFDVNTTASMGAGLPKMPWYGANDAYLRETRQKLEALRKDLIKAKDETLFKVRESWFRLDRAKREEALFAKRVVHLSQAALEVSTRGYETGKVTFADVIASYTSWLKDNLAVQKRKSDLGIASAELEETIGTSLRE